MLIPILFFSLMGVLAVTVIQKPARAIAGVLCLYGLKQWVMSEGPFFVFYRTIPNYAIAAILMLGLVVTVLRRNFRLGRYPATGWLSIALYTFALLSYAWTLSQFQFIGQWNLWWPYLICFVGLAPLLICDPKDLHHAMLATLALGTVAILILLYRVEWLGRSVAFQTWGLGRLDASRQGNPLAVAHMAAYVAIIATLMNFRGITRFWQVCRWVIVGLALILIVRSNSRGPLIAVLLALLVFLPLSRRINNVSGFLAVGMSVILLVSLAAWVFTNYADAKRWTVEQMQVDLEEGRLAASGRLLEEWSERGPIVWMFGIGSCGTHSPEVFGWYPEVVTVEILGELGLFGLTIWGSIIYLTLRTIWRARHLVAQLAPERGMLAAAGALFLFNLLIGFKGGSLLTEQLTLTFAIIVGRYALSLPQHVAALNGYWEPGMLPVQEYDVDVYAEPLYPQPRYA